ncbi:single-stranded DNA-binding protein [Mucilaginibacter sp. Mucisp86]|uniref:single-stranded DNA-binding protein n=1 Tax=Mucilaginibacter sp. Mucisp86 TaxID=3243060 RepID=UPI0039B5760F
MQQITGRLTADATVKQLEGGRQVVSFNIADNQSYRPKDGGDKVEIPTFFSCSYWVSTRVANVLRKGAVVQLNGRVSARAYSTNTGELATALNFHTSRIEVLSYAKETNAAAKETGGNKKVKGGKAKAGEDKEDLPF